MAATLRSEDSMPRLSTFTFTKLVVDDLEKMAAFYSQVYELEQITRMQDAIGSDAIDEIILGTAGALTPGALILLKYVDQPRHDRGGVILGFTTRDLPALLDRVRAAGGSAHTDIRDYPDMNVRVAFVTDPEGHLIEIVERS
jgi:predicted enzyme related to lactoylglutathione lyase